MREKKGVFAALFVAETIFLFYYSTVPFQPLLGAPLGARGGDAEHLGAYFLYGFLAVKVLDGKIKDKKMLLCAAFLVAIGVGGLNEVIQSFIPYRTADWLDMGINGAGAAIGLAASRVDWGM